MLEQHNLWFVTLSVLLLIASMSSSFAYEAEGIEKISAFSPISRQEFEQHLLLLNDEIQRAPKSARLYLERGSLYLSTHQFMDAILDFDTAIAEADMDEAYFGRGLAKGRLQEFAAAIADLDVYIQRHPNSSHAYTKRGIRNLWRGERSLAKQDFLQAIELNDENAEANDDVGVIYAQEKNYLKALEHFNKTLNLEPSYQKAYHNLAMTYYLMGHDSMALAVANKGLALAPETRNTLILKAEILKSMGLLNDAQEILDDAEFMEQGNWSESVPIN